MNQPAIDVNGLRIASPCPTNWESMIGDDRTRFCSLCKLNVYNIAGMTSGEVEQLLSSNTDRLCMRLYRRADGTVLTKDCPNGLRAYRKRAASLAGSVFAAILALFSISYGQPDKKAEKVDGSRINRVVDPAGESSLLVTIVDPDGALVPNAPIQLFKIKEKKPLRSARSDADGQVLFSSLAGGVYNIRVDSTPGFRTAIVENVEVSSGEKLEVDIAVDMDGDTITIGIIMFNETIDVTSTEIKTVITREMLERLPGGRPY